MSESDGRAGIGVRTTKQRSAVVAMLETSEDFRSAQEFHELMRQRGQRVGLATVYRTLQALAAAGEVDVILRDDGEAMYRRCSSHHHHHLVCRTCGVAVEVAGPAVERWAEKVAQDHGFTQVSHTVELFGLCARCS